MTKDEDVNDQESTTEDQIEDETVAEEPVVATEPGADTSDLGAANDTNPSSSEEEDDVIVTIGDEEPVQEEQRAPEWVRELRKSNREKEKRIKELEAKLSAPAEVKALDPGKKPTLEDHDYDADKFEVALTTWHDSKRALEQQIDAARKAEQAQKDAWQNTLDAYGKSKAELKVRDYEDAEAVAMEHLDTTQQGIVIHGSENKALLMYAIGKNPKKAKELGSIKDPVKFAFAVAKLEKELKVTSRKAPPPPEKTVTGTARSSGAVDSTLERLREAAEKSGDYTKVTQYKREQKSKSK